MTKRQLLSVLITRTCFSVLVCSAFYSSVAGQDIKPGASPVLSVGNPNAPVTIEVFNDYQCPPCAAFNEELKKIEAKYKGKVRIIFRNFPLTQMHENALSAAQAAEAAGLQGKFIEMINLLYENQWRWDSSKNAKQLFLSYARVLKLDIDKFSSDMEGKYVQERIGLDVERARSLNVLGTPTVLVNGKMLSVEELAYFNRIIKKAVNNAR